MATPTCWHKTKPVFLYSVRNSLLKVFNHLSLCGETKRFIANIVFLHIIVMLVFTAPTESLLLSPPHLHQPPTELAD